MSKKTELTYDEARERIQETYRHLSQEKGALKLIHVEYRDNLTHNPEFIETWLQDPREAEDNFYMENMDWITQSRYQSTEYIIERIRQEGEDFSDEARDNIRNACLDMDTSNPLDQLIENTPARYLYYDTGTHINVSSLSTADDIDDHVDTVCEALDIEDQENRDKIRTVVVNSSHSGKLVILMYDDIKNYADDGDHIVFEDPVVAIIDRFNGGGWFTEKPLDAIVTLPFNRKNLHDDEGAGGYSFTGDVCGLTGDQANVGVITSDNDNQS